MLHQDNILKMMTRSKGAEVVWAMDQKSWLSILDLLDPHNVPSSVGGSCQCRSTV